MIAYLFSGQGSQSATMAAPLLAASERAVRCYEEANRVVGEAIDRYDDEALADTRRTQLAVVTYSAALWDALDVPPHEGVCAGFSLGEYSALYAAGVVDLAGLLSLVLWRSAFMQDVIDANDALGMTAVIGLDADVVNALVQDDQATRPQDTWVYVANINSPVQTVLSGPKTVLTELAPRLKERGASRLIPLRVAGAFHTPYFSDAADRLRERARTLTFRPPTRPLYSNIDGQRLADDADIADHLARALIAPVRFTTELSTLKADGLVETIEVGPGSTLSGLVRKTLPGITTTHGLTVLAMSAPRD